MSEVDRDDEKVTEPRSGSWVPGIAMNAMMTVMVSAMFGSGTTLVLIETGLVDLDKAMNVRMEMLEGGVERVEDAVGRIDEAIGRMGDRLQGFERRQSNKMADDHEDTTVSLATLESNMASLVSRATRLVDVADLRSGLDALTEVSWDQDRLMTDRLSAAQQDRAKGREQLLEGMREIADTQARRQKAMEKMIDGVEKEGDESIRERDLARIGEWLALAHFVVSSLPLPERDGILVDRSVVATEIHDAKRRFRRTSGEEALSHARRALVAVQAVQRIVHGEQL